MKGHFLFILIAVLTIACKEEAKQNETPGEVSPAKLKALILDGQNNHYVWPKTSMMMKDYL